MKIVVIGGTGLIGSKVVQNVHALGHDACGWRRNPTAVKGYEARLRTLRGALDAVEGER